MTAFGRRICHIRTIHVGLAIALAGAGFAIGFLLAPDHHVTDQSTTTRTVALHPVIGAPGAAAAVPVLVANKKPSSPVIQGSTVLQPVARTPVTSVSAPPAGTHTTQTQATHTQTHPTTTELQPPPPKKHDTTTTP